MIKIKYLSLIALTSSTLLFSGCVQQPDTFSNNNRYYNNGSHLQVSLSAYAYPYYFDRPYYFLNGMYYYGGYYNNGLYHYGQRRFRHGHYYAHGNRYYNGRRYRARNGIYGYYKNRYVYNHSHQFRRDTQRIDRGREYKSRNLRKGSHGFIDRRKGSHGKFISSKSRKIAKATYKPRKRDTFSHNSIRKVRQRQRAIR